MDIDVRDLELLEAIDRHQTLTAAADQLYVSQPALSQRLVKLEQRLGTPLFERGRRLVATEAGRRTLRAAQVTLAELRNAVREEWAPSLHPGPTLSASGPSAAPTSSGCLPCSAPSGSGCHRQT